MASVAAIINVDGAPVDQAALRALVEDDPSRRSSQARLTADGSVGLAFVPLRPASSDVRSQPCSVDGRLWAVLDGRLDDRECLVMALGARCPRRDLARASDGELLLHAYDAWGVDCLSRLIGDFAFCLWDARQRQLVCARDHFGVKPLYYARIGNALVVSSLLRGIRRHPSVSGRLDETAIGDFLLFGLCMEPSQTPFAGVRRLPPAHRLLHTVSSGQHRVERYWSLQPGELVRYRHPDDYVEHFSSVLHVAVADRLREDRAGILMSGGLDSSSVAAVAADVLGSSAGSDKLRAYTAVYRTKLPDEEGRLASIVARSLGIGIEQLPVDRYEAFDRWETDALPPEPSTEVLTALMADLLERMARHSEVALTGDGGDPVLLPSTIISQLGRVPVRELVVDLWRSIRRVRACPPLGAGARLRAWLHRRSPPAWLADSLLSSVDPRARWSDVHARQHRATGARDGAVNEVVDPWWASAFESMDPGATRRAVEPRYPLFDLRLVTFAVTLPSYPWCVNKEILRTTMRDRLPESIRTRPKTPLAGESVGADRRWSLPAAIRLFEATPAMAQFVDIKRFRATVRADALLTDDEPGTAAALCLAAWLRCSAGEPLSVES